MTTTTERIIDQAQIVAELAELAGDYNDAILIGKMIALNANHGPRNFSLGMTICACSYAWEAGNVPGDEIATMLNAIAELFKGRNAPDA